MLFAPQRMCLEILSVFARGSAGSSQRRFRFYAAEYVQAAFGKKGAEHELSRDVRALLDIALDATRRDFGPSFVPQLAR
jgi:hypothetical protein